MEIIVKGHSMAGILVLVVVGTLLSDQGCDGAGVRRLTRRRKVLPASGKTPTDESGIEKITSFAKHRPMGMACIIVVVYYSLCEEFCNVGFSDAIFASRPCAGG